MGAKARVVLTIGQKIWYGYIAYVVVGETSRSWLYKSASGPDWMPPEKLPKADPLHDYWSLTEQAWEDWKYASDHREWIAQKIQNSWKSPIDAKILRQIAELIGYDPEKDMPQRRSAR